MNIIEVIGWTSMISICICLCVKMIYVNNYEEYKMGNSVFVPEWKTINQFEIDEIWMYKKYGGGGFRNAMICGTCKNANTDICDCAKARFIEKLSYEEFLKLKLSEQDRERLEKRIRNYNSE